jgi:hypothetical protein
MVIYEKQKPLLKRVPIVVDVYEGIQRYDLDNLYPQRVEEIAKRSYTTQSVIKRVADFLNGDGFIDKSLGKVIVNKESMFGTSLNKLLTQVSFTYATWNSIALHIGYNLNYRISSITHIPFSYCRMGLPDDEGKVSIIKYSTNWERDGRKEVNDRTIESYHIFNPDPEVVAMEIEQAGGIEFYTGQILYFTPEFYQYPLCSFDAVIDHAQAQGELGMAKVANTQNSFLSTMAILFPGEFESDAERQQFQDLIANKSGAKNLGTRIGLQDRSGTKKASDIFQPLTPTNVDRLYEFTEKSVVDAIMENEAMPKEILGVRPESGMFNQANMEQAYLYYNSITRTRRQVISEVFAMLMSNWESPIITNAEIQTQTYGAKTADTRRLIEIIGIGGTQAMMQIAQLLGQGLLTEEQAINMVMTIFSLDYSTAYRMLHKETGAETNPQGQQQAIDGQTTINENLKNLTGRQLQNIQRIVRKFNQSQLTYEQAKQMLVNGYGFTENDVADWLVTAEEEAQSPALNYEVLNKSYSDYPDGVRSNARRVLDWTEKNGWGSCGTAVGKARANQLAKGEAISVDTIQRMYSYLSRHEGDLDSSKSYSDGCGKLMYDSWGGKAALGWSRNKLRTLGLLE